MASTRPVSMPPTTVSTPRERAPGAVRVSITSVFVLLFGGLSERGAMTAAIKEPKVRPQCKRALEDLADRRGLGQPAADSLPLLRRPFMSSILVRRHQRRTLRRTVRLDCQVVRERDFRLIARRVVDL